MGKIYLGSTELKKVFAGTNEIKKIYLGSNEIWSSSSLPSWINPNIRNILDNLTPEGAYYVDFAWDVSSPVQGYTQFYYRVFCSINSSAFLSNPNSLYMGLYNAPSGFRGFSYYSWGYNTQGNWAQRYHYQNKSECSFYDTIQSSVHRAFIEGTLTSVTNTTGYTFEDYRS